MKSLWSVLGLLLCLIGAGPLPAATATVPTSGAIAGVVLDPHRDPLPQATVRLLDADGAEVARTLTGAEGRFRFTGVLPNRYTVQASLVGFEPLTKPAEPDQTLELVLALAPVREQVVVTATRTEASTALVGSSVTVIPHEHLEETDAITLTDALRTVPGLTPVQSGPPGSSTSLFARGGESDHNKVFLDGVPLNEPGGFFNFANLTALNIDRIEVVRGPQSALFGSDALGSTVQIFTRQGESETLRPHFAFSAEGGTHDEMRGTARVAGRVRWFDYSLAAGRFLTDNADVNSAFRNTTLSADLGARLSERTSLRFILHGDFGTAGTPGPTAFTAPDPNAFFRRHDADLVLSLRHDARRWRQQLVGSYARSRQRSIDPITAFGPIDFVNDSRRYRFQYQSDYSFSPAHTVTFAFEGERELAAVGLLFPPVPSADRSNFGYVVQYQGYFLGRLSLAAGVRVEDNQGFGTRAVPRLSLAYFLRQHGDWLGPTKLKLNAGLGVKEPQLFESLAAQPVLLAPERVRSFDFGVEQRFARDHAKLEVNWFDNRFRNLIVFKTLSFTPFLFTFVNEDKTRARGAEVTLEVAPGAGLRAQASYTYLDGKVVRSQETLCNDFTTTVPAQGQPLCRRPRHAGSLMALWDWHWLNLASTAVYVGRRADTDFLGLGLTRNGGYSRWDLAVNLSPPRRQGSRITYFAVVENLLDRRYMEVLGFPALRLTVRAGARVEF